MAGVLRSRAVSVWLPVLAWAGLIFTLSSLSGSNELPLWEVLLRKAAHVVEYAILGLLILRAVGHEATAFALGLAYAVSDEVHQHFVPRRNSSPRDVAIDALGLLLGILTLRLAPSVARKRRLPT
jgi:VanZ family protein